MASEVLIRTTGKS